MGFKLKSILAAAFVASVFTVAAQPVAIQQNLPAVEEGKVYTISGYTSAALDAEDNADNKFEPENIGRLLPAQITLQNSGEWSNVKGGKLWRLKIKADGAKGVALLGKVNQIPKGAKLNIYNADGSEWVNAYTANNFDKHNILSTETVTGEEAIVEYFQPDGAKQANFIIERIAYMYRHEKRGGFQRKSFGSAGACQVNANCSEGNFWGDQKKSVMRIRVIRDFTVVWCTGTLMQTTAKHYKPYILTAMHCGLNSNEDAFLPDTMFKYWIFYFNYEAPTCANPADEGTLADQNIVGAQVLAHSHDLGGEYGSDFLLLELSSIVPPEFNAYYCGWNIDTTGQYQDGVTIHHPQGDIKKISTYKWPLSFDYPFSTSPDNTHWEVFWSATVNGHGTTQGGSSGSPLFDNSGRVLGTLTGGNSSCNNKNGTDLYGRMDWHWTKNGTDSTYRLNYWLDPTNSGTTAIFGSYDELRSVFNVEALPLQLFPNPATQSLTINGEFLTDNPMQVQIIDVLGKEHINTTFSTQSIAVEHLPAGVYFVSVKQKDNYFSGKFIKQ